MNLTRDPCSNTHVSLQFKWLSELPSLRACSTTRPLFVMVSVDVGLVGFQAFSANPQPSSLGHDLLASDPEPTSIASTTLVDCDAFLQFVTHYPSPLFSRARASRWEIYINVPSHRSLHGVAFSIHSFLPFVYITLQQRGKVYTQ